MSGRTTIEWTDATWNPIRARNRKTGKIGWHCEHVCEACRNCYAEGFNHRLGTGLPFKPGHRDELDIFLDEKTLLAPLRWKRPRMIFPCSMTDLFGEWVTDEQLDRIFAVMALTPQHTYQVLTKRPERMRDYLRRLSRHTINGHVWSLLGTPIGSKINHDGKWQIEKLPLPNVWLLVSCGDQPDADKFIPILLDTPAAVRGVSYEPALGPLDLTRIDDGAAHREVPRDEWGSVDDDDSPPALWWNALTGERTIMHGGAGGEWSRHDASLDWVICGGESGPNARPMHPNWARKVRDDCAAAGVAFFMKQWGEWAPYDRGAVNGAALLSPNSLDTPMQRFGKKRAGRLLDGIEHNGFPPSPEVRT